MEHSPDRSGHESLVRHPIQATVEEVEHLRELVDDGDSASTPAIVVGAVLAFVVPFAALLIFLALVVAHLASR
jgi:hypothetical protein